MRQWGVQLLFVLILKEEGKTLLLCGARERLRVERWRFDSAHFSPADAIWYTSVTKVSTFPSEFFNQMLKAIQLDRVGLL